jgi:putative hydrolase of HD superfamily
MELALTLIDGKKICYNCLFKMDPETALTQVADFLFEVGMLKKTPRTGYQFLGNGFETVAAHSFRTAVIAFILAKSAPGADPEKALKMALFHDLAEARTGDHNYVNKQYVAVDEERATRDATRNIPNGLEVEALLLEYYAGETLEANWRTTPTNST